MDGFLKDLYQVKYRVSRSISAENPHGEKGKGG